MSVVADHELAGGDVPRIAGGDVPPTPPRAYDPADGDTLGRAVERWRRRRDRTVRLGDFRALLEERSWDERAEALVAWIDDRGDLQTTPLVGIVGVTPAGGLPQVRVRVPTPEQTAADHIDLGALKEQVSKVAGALELDVVVARPGHGPLRLLPVVGLGHAREIVSASGHPLPLPPPIPQPVVDLTAPVPSPARPRPRPVPIPALAGASLSRRALPAFGVFLLVAVLAAALTMARSSADPEARVESATVEREPASEPEERDQPDPQDQGDDGMIDPLTLDPGVGAATGAVSSQAPPTDDEEPARGRASSRATVKPPQAPNVAKRSPSKASPIGDWAALIGPKPSSRAPSTGGSRPSTPTRPSSSTRPPVTSRPPSSTKPPTTAAPTDPPVTSPPPTDPPPTDPPPTDPPPTDPPPTDPPPTDPPPTDPPSPELPEV